MDDWRNINRSLLTKIRFVMESGRFSDVKFIVGKGDHKHVFRAHRFILAANSAVFETMLYGSCAEKYEISIPNIESRGFAVMLRYFYTEELKIETLEDAFHTCHVATKYEVHVLREKCIELLEQCISPESACKIHDFAAKAAIPELIDKCLKTFSDYTKEVTSSESFKSSDPNTVRAIMQRPFLSIPSESYLFKALLRWGEEECSRQGHADVKSVLKPLLQYLIGSFLLPEHVVDVVKEYSLSTREQLCPLIHKMIKAVLPLPPPAPSTPFEPPDWAESVGLTLTLYLPQVDRVFTEVPGKRVSFTVEVTSGSLFLRGFIFAYRSLQKKPFTLLATVYLTTPGRFRRVKFLERLDVKEQNGLCYVFFPRGVFLEAGEHLDTAVHFENTTHSFQCEVATSSEFGHRMGNGTVLVVRCSNDSERMIIADIFGNYCKRPLLVNRTDR